MTVNAVVRARVDETIKADAAAVLADMGLTISDFLRMALTKVAKERAIPFETRIPNAETIATIEKSQRGIDVHTAKDADDLFAQLGIK